MSKAKAVRERVRDILDQIIGDTRRLVREKPLTEDQREWAEEILDAAAIAIDRVDTPSEPDRSAN